MTTTNLSRSSNLYLITKSLRNVHIKDNVRKAKLQQLVVLKVDKLWEGM